MPKQTKKTMAISILIITVTVAAHLTNGFVLKAPRTNAVYRRISPMGSYILNAARHINKDGVLVCNQKLAVFCANRKEIATWRYWKQDKHPADSFFIKYGELINNKELIKLIENKTFGIKYYKLPFIVLERGFSTTNNAAFIKLIRNPIVIAAYTRLHAGHNIHINNTPYRHWDGNGDDGAQTLLYGQGVILSPGNYKAVFTYKAKPSKNPENNSLGKFSIHRMNQQAHIAEAEITQSEGNDFITQSIKFEIDTDTKIEPRVITGYAELWISRISFNPQIKR